MKCDKHRIDYNDLDLFNNGKTREHNIYSLFLIPFLISFLFCQWDSLNLYSLNLLQNVVLLYMNCDFVRLRTNFHSLNNGWFKKIFATSKSEMVSF